MAKKTEAAKEAAEHSPYTLVEERAYVEAVIRKQCACDAAAAAKRAAALSAEDYRNLHDAGREGRVADCRTLLGL